MESCCTSPEVTGATYDRTYTNVGQGPTDEADPATVSNFRLDKYLVTVGRFRQYLNYLTSDAGAPPAEASGVHTHLNEGQGLANSADPGTFETGWDATDWNAFIATGSGAVSTWNTNLACGSPYDTWTNTPGTGTTATATATATATSTSTTTATATATGTQTSTGSQENLPINCVNWFEAYAFCIWDEGFLPSEAEWEYVAAGGSQQLEYPWGSADPATGNSTMYAIYNGCYASPTCEDTGVENIAPVGSATLGAAIWGQFDMAGEVAEWNLDWYALYVDPCTDCAYLATASYRIFRGGNFNDNAGFMRPAYRNFFDPTKRLELIGFRCARSAP
ncbi:MAG: formylglycine-generating enzyme family protein [Polyangiaceae bacterium]|jgi:formylglycine-generating enzyme required for sulfatase activity